MQEKELKEQFSEICEILATMNNKNEIYSFLRDLLSQNEIIEFSNRFEVAKMLDDKISYLKIEGKTGMSSTTIARISKFLN
jgi:TrpR-related protein YerC/YecD